MAPTTVPAARPFFRGWWMVLVSIVGQLFGIGTLLVFTFGVFAKPLASEFHASRGAIALSTSLLDLAFLVGAPGAGRLVDRTSARVVIPLSMIALAACLVGLSLVRPPLASLFVLYGLAGFLGCATTPVTYGRVISNWFDRRRGFALGLASTGIGLAAFVMPPLAQLLVDRGGWRYAYAGLATIALVTVPLVSLFLRSRPEDVGLTPDGELPVTLRSGQTPAPSGLTLGEALRTLRFWHLCLVFFLVAACGNGAVAHLVPMLTDRGVSGHSAALATSIFGAASVVGRVGNGLLVDRYPPPRVAAASFTGAALGVGVLLVGGPPHAAAALIGLAIGVEADLMPLLVSRYFGLRSMAEVFGCAFGSYTIGNATGRYLFGAGFDATGSYALPLACALGAMLVAALATLFFPPLGAPARA